MEVVNAPMISFYLSRVSARGLYTHRGGGGCIINSITRVSKISFSWAWLRWKRKLQIETFFMPRACKYEPHFTICYCFWNNTLRPFFRLRHCVWGLEMKHTSGYTLVDCSRCCTEQIRCKNSLFSSQSIWDMTALQGKEAINKEND